MSETTRIERLRAAIAEAERMAALHTGRVYADDNGPDRMSCIAVADEQWADGSDRLPNHHNYWTLIHDPTVVLRRCVADRKLLDLCERAMEQQRENAEAEARAWMMLEVFELMAEAYGVGHE